MDTNDDNDNSNNVVQVPVLFKEFGEENNQMEVKNSHMDSK